MTEVMHAKDLESDLQAIVRGRLKEMPPSEVGKVDQDILNMLRTKSPDDKMYLCAYNLRNPSEAWEAERLLNDGSLKILSSSIGWNPQGEMMYFLGMGMSTARYEEERREFVERDRKIRTKRLALPWWKRAWKKTGEWVKKLLGK